MTRRELEKKAQKIADAKTRTVACDLGGCDNHSGHEYCSRDAMWQDSYETALDNLIQEQEQDEYNQARREDDDASLDFDHSMDY